jgi:hypothetical protein
MRSVVFIGLLLAAGCNKVSHEKEIQEVCFHIEGTQYTQCNAGDDFSPHTCLTALEQYEGWWRGDAQTAVNKCMAEAACYPYEENMVGPSIVSPLEICLQEELLIEQPTTAQNDAVSRYCVRANACAIIGYLTETGCADYLLNPYGDGSLFLMMDDVVAARVGACESSNCPDLNACVEGVFNSSGAYNSIMSYAFQHPKLFSN